MKPHAARWPDLGSTVCNVSLDCSKSTLEPPGELVFTPAGPTIPARFTVSQSTPWLGIKSERDPASLKLLPRLGAAWGVTDIVALTNAGFK
jgi:hypothetical protein